jgi:hypothetical protein
MSDFESDFIKFTEKFKSSKGLVNSTMINKARIAREQSSQYRRNLLAHAVSKGMAWSNDKHYTHNKYGIHFNAEDRVNLAVESTFDSSVLNHPNIIDLPPRRLKNSSNIEHWNRQKEEWIEIYILMCSFQLNGKINLELLPAWYHHDLKKIVSMKTREIIFIYEMLKLGWDEIGEYFSSNNRDYNDLFQEVLWAKSICMFSSNRVNLIDRPRAQLNYLREIHDAEIGLGDVSYSKAVSRFFGKNSDWFYSEIKDPLNDLSGCDSIKKFFKKASVKDIRFKNLFDEWGELDLERKEFNKKYLDRKNDKRRTANFEKKILELYLKQWGIES